jgi:hypothetical protein
MIQNLKEICKIYSIPISKLLSEFDLEEDSEAVADLKEKL